MIRLEGERTERPADDEQQQPAGAGADLQLAAAAT